MNVNQDALEKLTQAWISFKRMNFPLAFSQAREAAIIVETFTAILNQMGVSEDNPSFTLPEPTKEDIEETTEISTTLPSTHPSSTQIEDTSTTLTTQTRETSATTSLSVIGVIIAFPILLIYKKKNLGK